MNISSWDGTLSESDFSVSALAFADKWKSFNSEYPSWSWIACPKKSWATSHQEEGYLSLENTCLLKPSKEVSDEEGHIKEEGIELHEEEEFIDQATLVQSHQHEAQYYDFHVVYSPSYKVPVLYFRAYDSDGRTLPLDEIEQCLPSYSAEKLLESKWTFITLEEHPYLYRPWYKLHPCGTSEWIKLLFLGDSAMAKRGVQLDLYLVSWLSVVGQVVGLRIPFEMLNGSQSNSL